MYLKISVIYIVGGCSSSSSGGSGNGKNECSIWILSGNEV